MIYYNSLNVGISLEESRFQGFQTELDQEKLLIIETYQN